MRDESDGGGWTLVGQTMAFLGTLLSALLTGLLGVRIARISVDAQTKAPAPSPLYVVNERDVWQALERELAECRARIYELEHERTLLEKQVAAGLMWKEIALALRVERDSSAVELSEKVQVERREDEDEG